MNINTLLDEYKKRFQIEEEQEVALHMGISPAQMSQVRRGTVKMPKMAFMHLIDKLGYALSRDMALYMLPEAVRNEAKRIDAKRLKERMPKGEHSELERLNDDDTP